MKTTVWCNFNLPFRISIYPNFKNDDFNLPFRISIYRLNSDFNLPFGIIISIYLFGMVISTYRFEFQFTVWMMISTYRFEFQFTVWNNNFNLPSGIIISIYLFRMVISISSGAPGASRPWFTIRTLTSVSIYHTLIFSGGRFPAGLG